LEQGKGLENFAGDVNIRGKKWWTPPPAGKCGAWGFSMTGCSCGFEVEIILLAIFRGFKDSLA
jgi:hypothetical protein